MNCLIENEYIKGKKTGEKKTKKTRKKKRNKSGEKKAYFIAGGVIIFFRELAYFIPGGLLTPCGH